MKNKNTAALLAFTTGFIGVHRFYLEETGKGILYIFGTCGAWFFTFKIMLLISIFDGIRFLKMSQEEFDEKYNKGFKKEQRNTEEKTRKEQRRSGWEEMEKTWNVNSDAQGYKKEGIAKYKAFDFGGAIKAFEKVLIQEKNDAATYFNLACCYSMIEDKGLAFSNLAKSVELGMKDFQKISTHDGLAYLRIQSEWDNFVASDYKSIPVQAESRLHTEPKLSPEPAQELDPLDALRKLYEQRQKGVIDEEQFEKQSRELLH